MSGRTEKSTKSDQVYNIIKDKIMSGEYSPHTLIKQGDVAKELGVSTVPVREALSRLTTEGFILHIPYVGVMVSNVTADYLSKVYELRAILEGAAASMAVKNFTSYDIDELDGMLEEMEAAEKAGDIGLYQEINERFHFLIYSRSDNELLLDHIKILWRRFPRDTFKTMPVRLTRSLEEHRMMVSAIKNSDPTWCSALTVSHIKSAQDDIRKYRSS